MVNLVRIVTLCLAIAIAIWLRSWVSVVIVAAAVLLAWFTRERKAA